MINLSFTRRQQGSVTIVFMFSMAAIVLSLLAALDIMRYTLVQARLQSAMDAAVLAAGRNLGNLSDGATQAQQDAWKQDALGYLQANMPNGYMGSTYDISKVVVTVTGEPRTGQQISMQATGELPLLVAGFLATKTLQMGGSNTAQRLSRSDLELVLVLDNTGSMADPANPALPKTVPNSKIVALQSAANSMVDTLFGNGNSTTSVNMGLVPFATTVDVRDANNAKPVRWVKNGVFTPFISANTWSGCLVEPRSSGLLAQPPQVLDPASKPFSVYFGPGSYSPTPTPTTLSKLDASGCINGLTTFLTSNVPVIRSGISTMAAGGSTAISTGVLWGWRMLSPSWRGVSGWGSTTLPQDKSSYLTKAMIIMTDGNNEINSGDAARFNMYGVPNLSGLTLSSPSSNGKTFDYTGTPAAITAFKALNGGNDLLPYGITPDFNNATTFKPSFRIILDNLTLATCKAARDDGVKIWTITFGSGNNGPDAQGKSVMQNCASNASNYYNAPSAADLQAIFQNIAGQLSELRLIK